MNIDCGGKIIYDPTKNKDDIYFVNRRLCQNDVNKLLASPTISDIVWTSQLYNRNKGYP